MTIRGTSGSLPHREVLVGTIINLPLPAPHHILMHHGSMLNASESGNARMMENKNGWQ